MTILVHDLVYIQVNDDIGADSTLERELAPFLFIRDAFSKVLIARTMRNPFSRSVSRCALCSSCREEL